MRQTVMWTMVAASLCLVLSAAAGVGEARVLADRGVTVATVAADDGSRWIQANGALYEARADTPTAIADPNNHALNAASIGAHVRSATATPALLAVIALVVALGARGRTPSERPSQTTTAEIIELRRAIAAVR
jgi:hypothetical protein